MAQRKNFMLDGEAVSALQEHPNDNHSEIIRELVKEYYTVGSKDVTEAAVKVRKREIRKQLSEVEAEQDTLRAELERLEEIAENTETESDIEQVASEIEVANPDIVSADNPAIQSKAELHGIDPNVLAEVVKENAVKTQAENLESVTVE